MDIKLYLDHVFAEVFRRQRLPEATYRLQFHAGFTFRAAAGLAPYLDELGVTDCYASPYLKARPGSLHGYDITDHRCLNPEIGDAEDHAAFTTALQERGLGQLLDIVPNHMGVVGNENPWWNDVLENGPASPQAGTFDIAWQASPRPELRGRILLPVLGEPYGKALEAGQLRITFAAGAFTLGYFDHRIPISPSTYDQILGLRLEELEASLRPGDPKLSEYQSILTAIKNLPACDETSPEKIAERRRDKEVVKRRLAALVETGAEVRAFLEESVHRFNGVVGDPRSFDLLERLLDAQPYRLSFWRVASDEINYRRFFDVNELAALSMDREEVFAATHELIFRLLRECKVTGLRIDHPDGLYDPGQYLRRLQQHYVLEIARSLHESDAGFSWEEWEGSLRTAIENRLQAEPTGLLYVLVEKILGPKEVLPEDWPTRGTTGYEFLNVVNGLFVDGDRGDELTAMYRAWANDATPFDHLVYDKKVQVLQDALASELHMLAHELDRLAQKHRWSRDFTLNGLRQALRAVIAAFPVYRTYVADAGVPERDRKVVLRAMLRARQHNPTLSSAVFDFVRGTLLLQQLETATEEDKAEQRRFVGKFQQVTAPVMAKGVEDTAFYDYNRLLSLNEVGGDPTRHGVAPAALHEFLQERQARWPRALSTTATHDTKRGEDVRARLNVLSEVPDEWRQCIDRWGLYNRKHKVDVDEEMAPDGNEEWFLYQTLVGAWPLDPEQAAPSAGFVARIQAYVQKALHEAKAHSSWINPNPAYDHAVAQFVAALLDPTQNAPFLDEMRAFVKRVNHLGLFNSLAQTAIKLTAPGVPDTYQGTELWDFSLVDPDNRRPVDYGLRRRLLADIKARVANGDDLRAFARELTLAKDDGRIKLYVTWLGLDCRRRRPGLFSEGDYFPVEIDGKKKDCAFAFLRRQGDQEALVIVPRMIARLVSGSDQQPLGSEAWGDTTLLLPQASRSRRWRNLCTRERLAADARDGLAMADVLGHFPVALLEAEP